MVFLKLALIGIGLIFGASASSIGTSRRSAQKAPKLNNTWWGPGNEETINDEIKPFKIIFSQEDITDLKSRLGNRRSSQPALEGVAWNYGVDSAYMSVIVDYWQNKYNFSAREEHLNQYPQFTTNIQGLDIHFLHVKPKDSTGKRVLPLLIQHGWPGSVVEFYKIIPLLTTPQEEYDFVFEIIAPSLPGFGFSSGTTKRGLGPAEIAVVLKNLMLRLGFNKFYTQGGDWGAIITANLASLFPKHVFGMHSNLCRVQQPENDSDALMTNRMNIFWPASSSPDTVGLASTLSTNSSAGIMEMGYFHIQATKPDTLGNALADSPVGLAAWILEKFSTGTNPTFRSRENGGLLDTFSADELLDNLMMYWIPNSITTSVRIYAEYSNAAQVALQMDYVPINVPSACAQFPYEISYQPADVLRSRFKKLIRAERMPRGGHFAAFEQPELLSKEIWISIGMMESARRSNRVVG